MTHSQAVLFDIDGVLTVSWQPIPGAGSAVERIRELGWKVAFVTNTTSTTRRGIEERLERAGFAVQPDEIFTAPRAALLTRMSMPPLASVVAWSTSGRIDSMPMPKSAAMKMASSPSACISVIPNASFPLPAMQQFGCHRPGRRAAPPDLGDQHGERALTRNVRPLPWWRASKVASLF